ncbi:MAG: glycoside hydrolase family 15 protein [Candidatus Parvarchaeota archaeon]|nr:glycoside hydrolase family 15 protein [Candidatus Jingweiarchaeum tengchongense]MCW1298258.1 glycoside hydrolase family 15 protein [Candidatus Jingweiarchaeum tengchongense]MCW1300055.1 glycoside hydrolase family 15 protein [Candidatus Jingweiarchaeum tengchongense]MCW1304806.1 glycoside hydrolase family 15 protein [Candidatus Jingweiarchaeum tengchongense]MCW1305396.1 glycoside hydrolase family 15 protein [Candidatus Jingweiarchaeum tengchongense]
MKIRKIYKKSIEVIKNCSLKNGAIVAADITDEIYPNNVQAYDYVWPRDASYVCVACDLIGLSKIPEKFFNWCWERAELFKEKGVFLANKFAPNGTIAGELVESKYIKKIPIKVRKRYTGTQIRGFEFQPDQTGSLLWAIWHHSKHHKTSKFNHIVEKSADGVCGIWKKDHFKLPSFDLWEERIAWPEKREKHTYSLAMCAKGLECAIEMVGDRKNWKKCMDEMKNEISKAYVDKLRYFVRTFGINKIDPKIDSSMFALVWPCEIFSADDERIVNTVGKIIKENEINGGIMRYRNDKYDGKIRWGKLILNGAGAWPILNFFASIYFSKLGDRKRALEYFNWVIERSDGKIPEQIKNDRPCSINPLAWSHAMFIIAAKYLNLI